MESYTLKVRKGKIFRSFGLYPGNHLCNNKYVKLPYIDYTNKRDLVSKYSCSVWKLNGWDRRNDYFDFDETLRITGSRKTINGLLFGHSVTEEKKNKWTKITV